MEFAHIAPDLHNDIKVNETISSSHSNGSKNTQSFLKRDWDLTHSISSESKYILRIGPDDFNFSIQYL